ncbi:MAG: hypothetical protein GTO18_07940 [Anaerolineales bacterium]|nr:hypothetical protein [Anaerolineales bacterium]
MQDVAALLEDLTSDDDQRAETAIEELSRIGEPAVQSVLDLAKSADPDHRWWALHALAALNTPLASQAFIGSLSDSDVAVRHCAALGLRHNPSEEAIPHLIDVLSSDDRLFARLAGDALTVIGKPAIPTLANALQSEDPALRGEAARALALMQDPETIPILFTAIEDPSGIVQHWVEEGLDRLGVGMAFFKS